MAAEAVRLAPDDPAPAEELASIYADAGDAGRLMPLAEGLLARFGAREAPMYYHASALFMQGRAAAAVEELRRVVAGNPRHARAQNLMGAACATMGSRDCARAAFEAALEANPHDPVTYVNWVSSVWSRAIPERRSRTLPRRWRSTRRRPLLARVSIGLVRRCRDRRAPFHQRARAG